MPFWFEKCYSLVHHVQYLCISPSVPNSYVTYQSVRPQRYISAPYSLRKKMAAVTDSVNTILHLIVVCLYSIVTNLRILNNRSLYHACKGMLLPNLIPLQDHAVIRYFIPFASVMRVFVFIPNHNDCKVYIKL